MTPCGGATPAIYSNAFYRNRRLDNATPGSIPHIQQPCQLGIGRIHGDLGGDRIQHKHVNRTYRQTTPHKSPMEIEFCARTRGSHRTSRSEESDRPTCQPRGSPPFTVLYHRRRPFQNPVNIRRCTASRRELHPLPYVAKLEQERLTKTVTVPYFT